jgi:hypothetical protein
MSSGLYERFTNEGSLLPFRQRAEVLTGDPEGYATLEPDPLSFVSYPWEWSFDMLKDAARCTLHLLRGSVANGFILKDATPFNVQWYRGQMTWIDSLSFERHDPARPWVAYRSFCEQFLAPLLLMHYSRQPLQGLHLAWPEGIPLRTASKLLPFRSRFSLHTWLHVHLHARMTIRKRPNQKITPFSLKKMTDLITSLELLVQRLRLPECKTGWSDYYSEAAGRGDYLDTKKRIVNEWIDRLGSITNCADLGANDGTFSRLTADRGIFTIAADADAACVNRLYRSLRDTASPLHPLVCDIANPAPGTGVLNTEQSPLLNRIPSDLVLALGLVHHLAIARNMPLSLITELLARCTRKWLIVEFIPKTDEKVQSMLAHRKDVFPSYDQQAFEQSLRSTFHIEDSRPIAESGRTLYLASKT